MEHGEETLTLTADVVVASCGAINSAALLLRSASARHPSGLANGSGSWDAITWATSTRCCWQSRTPNPRVPEDARVNDFYFGAEDFPYPMGHISFVGKLDAVALSAGAPPFVPGMTLEAIARHSLDFWLTSEDLPDRTIASRSIATATSSSPTDRTTKTAIAS